MKKKIKIAILILVVIIVYFVKIKNYGIEIDENDVQFIQYIDIVHVYNNMDYIVDLNCYEVDDETQKIIVDMINNSKYKLKKIILAKNYQYSFDIGNGEHYRMQSVIYTNDYDMGVVIATDNIDYSNISVEKFGGLFRFEYRFEKESFDELNKFIKDYMDTIEQ